MKNDVISKLIAKKTGAYLRLSILLFLFSLILLSSSFIFIQHQYHQTESDFIQNKNTHLIEVTSSVDKNNPTKVSPLLFKDEQNISKLISSKIANGTLVYSEYAINFGIPDHKDKAYFIRGIDESALKSLGLPVLVNNSAFSSPQIGEQNILLRYPIIQVEGGGFSSSQFVEAEMHLTPMTTKIPPLDALNTSPDTIFVNDSTFKNIIEKMYHIKWDAFVKDYDTGTNFGIQAVNGIFVYVDKLSDVKGVAEMLENNGYSVRYTLSAFDDISKSITGNYLVMGLMLLFIYIVTAVNVVISFHGYIMSMQKDMGILLHYGYSRHRVYHIYKRVILQPYTFVMAVLVAYTFILAIIFLKSMFMVTLFITLAFLFLLVGSIAVILLYLLRRVIQKEILYLLKASKEME